MKKLSASVDARNRHVPVYESSNYVNYYEAPTGVTALEIPSGARYIEITALDEPVWYKIGNEGIGFEVPDADVTDGSSPRYIPAESSVLHRMVEEGYIALQSVGGVVVSYWRQ